MLSDTCNFTDYIIIIVRTFSPRMFLRTVILETHFLLPPWADHRGVASFRTVSVGALHKIHTCTHVQTCIQYIISVCVCNKHAHPNMEHLLNHCTKSSTKKHVAKTHHYKCSTKMKRILYIFLDMSREDSLTSLTNKEPVS